MNKYTQFFTVYGGKGKPGINVEISPLLGCKIYTDDKAQSELVMNYLKNEGYFDRQNEMVPITA